MKKISKYSISLLFLILFAACEKPGEKITENLTFIEGDVNSAVISSGEKKLVIYGTLNEEIENAEMVLFTHANRDVTWAGEKLVKNGSKAIVPFAELVYFTKPDSIWNTFPEAQFHDYSLNTVRVPTELIKVHRSVKDGDIVNWNGIEITVLDSHGYSPGAVSYLAQIDGLKVVFVGDLIYGDGEILDLFSFQDEIPELDVLAYHGFAARISEHIKSLKRILEFEPELLIPAHGPLIRNPELAVNKLIKNLQKVYRNFLSTSAYKWHRSQNWFYNPDILNDLNKRVSSGSEKLSGSIQSEMGNNPGWLKHFGISKLILSKDKSGFLIDCGDFNAWSALQEPEKNFDCSGIEGIFITHYHDDHTNYIAELQKKYNCPVYVTAQLEDILKNPEAYKMPAMTSVSIANLQIVEDNSTLKWKEFEFTFYDFPGQTLYHDAMLAEHKNGEKIFFAGDSFSPTGIDDYCLLNRNFIKPGFGYFKCLDLLETLPDNTWLVNNHIEPSFKFNQEQLSFMKESLMERQNLLAELFPWDDLNYGIDANWAKMYPYSQIVQPGETVEFSVVITNHSRHAKEFTVAPDVGRFICEPLNQTIKIDSDLEGVVKFRLQIPEETTLRNHVITSSIQFDGTTMHRWCESVLIVKK